MALPDHGHFLELFLAHQDSLFGFVLANGVAPADADDVVQNAAAVLWQRFDEFETGTNFRAWAFAVTRLEIRKNAARQARHSRRTIRLADTALDQIVDAAEDAPVDPQADIDATRTRHLANCLAKLGGHAREILTAFYRDGDDARQIAERLGVSHGALRVRLCRIRQGLQRCIDKAVARAADAADAEGQPS